MFFRGSRCENESKIILPSHLAHIDVHHKSRNPVARLWELVQGTVVGTLRLFIDRDRRRETHVYLIQRLA